MFNTFLRAVVWFVIYLLAHKIGQGIQNNDGFFLLRQMEYFQSSNIANDLPFDTLGEYLSWGKGVSKVDIGERWFLADLYATVG